MLVIGRKIGDCIVANGKINGESPRFGDPRHIQVVRLLNDGAIGFPIYVRPEQYFQEGQEFVNFYRYGRKIIKISGGMIEFQTISPTKKFKQKEILAKSFFAWVKRNHPEYIENFEKLNQNINEGFRFPR